MLIMNDPVGMVSAYILQGIRRIAIPRIMSNNLVFNPLTAEKPGCISLFIPAF